MVTNSLEFSTSLNIADKMITLVSERNVVFSRLKEIDKEIYALEIQFKEAANKVLEQIDNIAKQEIE